MRREGLISSGEHEIPEINTQHKKNMKILIATFWNYPHVGGLSTYITNLKQGLQKLGHSVDVVPPNYFEEKEWADLRKKTEKLLKEFYLNRYGSYSKMILRNSKSFYTYEMMLRKMNLQKYDIFHAQDLFTANILGKLNQSFQKPLFFTPHGHYVKSRLKFNLIEKGSIEEAYFRQIEKKAIENASHMIILCDSFRPDLKELGAEDKKMTTIYTGIDFKEEKAEKKKDKVVITCISRLGPRKGHKYLFDALSMIKKELANVEVLIAGDGEMRDELEKQVRDLQLSHYVRFLGERSDVPKLLGMSDIYVLPTVNDSLPLAIIEAMFARQAIITTNCGGIPEIVRHNHTGLITEPGNTKELAEKLLLLLKDELLREKLAANAKLFAETHLTVKNMASKIAAVYQSFL